MNLLARLATALLGALALSAAWPLTATAPAQPSWPTYHRDALRSGADPDATEPIAPFQAWQSPDLGAPIWGQPLVLGDRVYVATVGNDLYALDAATGEQAWKRHLGTPVPAGKLPCGDISPTVGIVGTPVIDTATGKIFAVADTWNATTEKAVHVLKGYTLEGKLALTTSVDPPGSEPKAMLQRTALNLDAGHVVFGFGGNKGDCGDYQGTVVSAPETKGAAAYWRYQPAAPSSSGGAVWATNGPTVDAAGNILASTGNPDPPAGEKAETYDYSDSVIELDAELSLIGHFEPPSWLSDSNSDVDLGSTGPQLLPGGMIFQGGKNGTGYLLDAGTLGEGAPPVFSHQICGGHGSFGGDSYADGVIYIPCTNGTQALAYNQAERSFTVLWQGPADAFGPPIVSGGLVWAAATGGFAGGGTKLYGLAPATGTPVYTETLPSPIADHFASPSAAGGRLFIATGSTVTALTISALSPPPPAPVAETAAASAVGATGAELNGTVDPGGAAVTDCHFDYGPTEAYGSSVPCETLPGSGAGPEPVSAALTGLSPQTTYHYRLVATGAGGTGTGADETLTTLPPPPPQAVTGAASDRSDTSATLGATVDPAGFAVTGCRFEYGPDETYGATVPCSPSPGSGTGAVAVSGAVTGLSPGTSYHFRIVAEGPGGTSSGSDAVFDTLVAPPPAPGVSGQAPSSVTETSAQLHAQVNPNGAEVGDCHFDYGTSEAYGSSVPCTALPEPGSSPVAVTAALAGLQAGTTYHFRISATGPGGTSTGADQTLKTLEPPPPPPAPTVSGGAASAITQSSALLSASVNPNGSAVTECSFQYGTTAAYGASVPCSGLPGAGTAPVAVSASLAGLAASTTYHFRLVAVGAGGSAAGADRTLTTAAPLSSPAPGPGPAPLGSSLTPPPAKNSGVAPFVSVRHPSPVVTLASSYARVARTGRLALRLRCATGARACNGRTTLRTVGSPGSRAGAAMPGVTLGRAAFAIRGGQTAIVVLHLGPHARDLLVRRHPLPASLALLASDGAGLRHGSHVALLLHLATAVPSQG